MQEFMDYGNLQKQDFSFPGNYRAIVEDTDDPLDAGRVRVRILGLHSPDPDLTPVSHLIWAEPALSLYYAGGQMTASNLNDDVQNKQTDRYYPTKDVEPAKDDIPDSDVQELTPTDGVWKDEILEKCGASGIYTVPRKGSVVWVFFEDGFHGRCHYWASATRSVDWEIQRNKIDEIINEKRDEVQRLRDAATIDAGERRIDQDDHVDTVEPVQRLKVFTKIPDPKLFIHNLDNIRNDEITSFTSAFGTTYIIVNRNGEERTYVFHRGHADYVDERGQVKKLVGLSDNDIGRTEQDSDIDQSKQPNDYQMMVGNNYELHVIGDCNIYAKNNVHIDAEQDLYAVVRRNAGVVVKSGDLDLLCEGGHVNISCPQGNVNVRCQDMQAKVEENLVAEVGQDIDAKVLGNAYMNIDGTFNLHAINDVNIQSDANINLEAAETINVRSNDYEQVTNNSWNLLGTESVIINSNGSIEAAAAAASLKLSSSVAEIGSASTRIAGNTEIGGTVTMGANAPVPTPGEVADVSPITIQDWQNWRDSVENIDKNHQPNEQIVNDEDSAG